MPTTFNVFFFGNTGGLRIDPIEGNNVVENAPLLQGTTFGSVGNPLLNNIAQFSPGSTGFAGGNSNAYDTNNAAVGGGETFRIKGNLYLAPEISPNADQAALEAKPVGGKKWRF